eukprot:1182654-Prorocentrum_minimum.AAC.2
MLLKRRWRSRSSSANATPALNTSVFSQYLFTGCTRSSSGLYAYALGRRRISGDRYLPPRALRG